MVLYSTIPLVGSYGFTVNSLISYKDSFSMLVRSYSTVFKDSLSMLVCSYGIVFDDSLSMLVCSYVRLWYYILRTLILQFPKYVSTFVRTVSS